MSTEHLEPAQAQATTRGLPRIDSLDELCRLVAPDAYVRFSKGPDDDDGSTSRDYESGLDLPGLSVNPLQPEQWWTRPLDEWLARQICNYVHLGEEEDRYAWVLTGTAVSRGPDNEPLVAKFTPVAVLSEKVVDEAKRLYEERFDTGEDSTDD